MQKFNRKIESTGRRLLIISLMVVLLGLLPAAVGAGTYTLNPVDDACVISFYPDFNYSYFSTLYVGREFAWPLFWRSFLRFDLSGLPDGEQITQATLSLYADFRSASTNFDIDMRHAADNWEESTITWNTQPIVGNILDTQTNTTTGYWMTWNLLAQTGQWDWQTDLTDNAVTLLLRIPTEDPVPGGDTFELYFPSSESSTNKPKLEITTSPVPLPGALLLLGSGLLGLGLASARRRFGK